MIKFFKSPIFRISIGILTISISLFLFGYLLGLIPDKTEVELNTRKKLAEALAVQFSINVGQRDYEKIEETLALLIDIDPEVLSAAIRTGDGEVITTAGDHKKNWQKHPEDLSTLEHVQTPIFQGTEKWGTIEIRFTPTKGNSFLTNFKNSLWGILLFLALSGSIAYTLFLKCVLKDLDPLAVIPERIKLAFDSLAEGVLILDKNEQVVLANRAFCDATGVVLDNLIGRKASSLSWQKTAYKQLEENWQAPWLKVLENGTPHRGDRLNFSNKNHKQHTFMVNCAPILDDKNVNRGVLVTFDDVSQREEKNLAMQEMLKKLERSKTEISRQNDRLKILAEQDPLTNCYNRRALYAQFNGIFDSALHNDMELSCMMVDIDHFKRINDSFGHQTGDKVIKLVANIIKRNLRESDIVGRYGGEEFCVVLPGIDLKTTLEIAERIRKTILDSKEYHPFGIERITASIGVTALCEGVNNYDQLIERADKALYHAKNNGRNCVAVSHSQNDTGHIVETTINHEKSIPDQPLEAQNRQVTHLNAEDLSNQEKFGQKQPNSPETNEKFDSTTGLPGREIFYDRLQSAIARAKRSGDLVAVLSISFQIYKRIRNTLGHCSAEQLIIKISQKISSVLRETDTIFLEFDEPGRDPVLSRQDSEGFFLLLPDLKHDQAINTIVKRIQKAFSSALSVEGFNLKINSKIGVSVYPVDSNDPEQLIKYADLALHHSQTSIEHNACQFYSQEINQQFEHQLKIESELLHAIERGELELYYQPILDLNSEVVDSFEVLVRWNHPEKGLLSAQNFISIAEQCGLITAIGDWALKTAIKQLAIWLKELSEDISISVNLSALQLQQYDLPETIISYLKASGVPGHRLMLEITESIIVENMVCAIHVMEKLHEFGIRIAVDDFGTGYSSLQHIQKFPIDILKIDRSFIQEIDSNKTDVNIVSAIVDMAKHLELSTIVEGVETEAQLGIVKELNCTNIQGYLISKPVPSSKIPEILQKWGINRSQDKSFSKNEIASLKIAT